MSTIVIGLSMGMLLFLLAAGLTLIFGMLRVINFAHGSFYMLGAYLAFQVVNVTGNFWAGLIAAPIIAVAVGAIMERIALRPVYDRDHVYQLLLTFGFILVLDEAVRIIWGLEYKQMYPPAMLSSTIEMFGSAVPTYRLFIIGFGAAVSAALFFMLDRSRFGMIIRAASGDPEMVRTLGINVSLVRTGVFAFGAGLAALGGAVAGPLFPIELGMGFNIIIDSFIVVIIGGLGNIRGAVMAALLIGMTRALGYSYAPSWVDFLTFILLIGTLILRPERLFSRKGRTA